MSIIQTPPRDGALVTSDAIRHRDGGGAWMVEAKPAVSPEANGLASTGELVGVAFVEAPEVYSLH